MNVMPSSRSIEEHTLKRPKGLIEVDTVLDVGAGIRPMQWYKPKRHVCLEPHQPYASVLDGNGYNVHQGTAWAYLSMTNEMWDAIYFLDVIEHMNKTVGRNVLVLAAEKAKTQVIVYAPFGFVEQEGDAWGMGGEHWQAHRSGWMPEDFEGWDIERNGKEGFFAICTHK